MDAKSMNFTPEVVEPVAEKEQSWRRTRHQANPTVQMSVRMREADYEEFRSICMQERRSNGDMLHEMMFAWKRDQDQYRKAKAARASRSAKTE